MKNTRVFSLMLLLFLSPLFAEEPAMDFGRIEGSTFVHDYFGFKVQIPDQWQVQDSEARDNLMKMGREIIAGDNPNMKAVVDASKLNSVNLLTVFRHPLGSAVDFNPSFVVVAEKVSHLPGIKKGSDYNFHAKRVIQAGQLAYKFLPEEGSENIGGLTFDYMNTELNLNSVLIKQRFYSTILKGYAFCLVVSYHTDEYKTALNEFLKTVQFQKP